MAVKILKPTTPGRRKMSTDGFSDITAKEPKKSLVVALKSNAGRNAQGRITVRHRGGGAKRYYRLVDFAQDKFDMEGMIKTVEYDPNRNARIALIEYKDGESRYIIVPDAMRVGDKVLSSLKAIAPNRGNRMPLKYIPAGQPVFNIELRPGTKGVLARSAGNSAKLLVVEGGFAQLQLPSGEVRKVSENAAATIGHSSNPDHRLIRWGKAGRMRYRGRRPTVRGKAMNPVDHPHGGGEGKHPIGMTHPKTPWGKHALGVKTRKRGKWSDALIIKRRK